MSRSHHRIRKQSLVLDVETEAQARALQPRLSSFNRQRLLAIIEQVFDALDVPDLHVRIDRLDVDLGTVSSHDFEAVVAERLSLRLREVVEQAVRERRETAAHGEQPRTEAQFQLELLEYYLLHGTLPFWAPNGTHFSFGALFASVARSNPEALVRLVGRNARMAQVIERLVLQLDQTLLERLITLLEPKHAALLIDYIVSLQALHRVEPVLPLSDQKLSRLLWSLTLTYLVRDAGSQFNRKSALRQLLEGVSESQGLDYTELVTTLALGLDQVRHQHPILSSLAAVIGELVRELPPEVSEVVDSAREESREEGWDDEPARMAATVRYALTEALRYYLQHGVLPWATSVRTPELTVERALSVLPELPRSMLRRALSWESTEGSMGALVRAVRRMPDAVRTRLLVRLMPPSGEAGSPLRSALPVFIARAHDKPLFFARVIAALLDGEPVVLDALASSSGVTDSEEHAPVSPLLGEWDAHALKSQLAQRLRDERGLGESPSALELLEALLSHHPEDARLFLLSLRGVDRLRTALVDLSSPALLARMMEVLRPREAGTMGALRTVLEQLPEQALPGGRSEVRQVLFSELLQLGEARPLTSATFRQVLARLFGRGVPREVWSTLTDAASEWSRVAHFPAKHLAAFRDALESFGPREDTEPPPGPQPDGGDMGEGPEQGAASGGAPREPTSVHEGLLAEAGSRRASSWVEERAEFEPGSYGTTTNEGDEPGADTTASPMDVGVARVPTTVASVAHESADVPSPAQGLSAMLGAPLATTPSSNETAVTGEARQRKQMTGSVTVDSSRVSQNDLEGIGGAAARDSSTKDVPPSEALRMVSSTPVSVPSALTEPRATREAPSTTLGLGLDQTSPLAARPMGPVASPVPGEFPSPVAAPPGDASSSAIGGVGVSRAQAADADAKLGMIAPFALPGSPEDGGGTFGHTPLQGPEHQGTREASAGEPSTPRFGHPHVGAVEGAPRGEDPSIRDASSASRTIRESLPDGGSASTAAPSRISEAPSSSNSARTSRHDATSEAWPQHLNEREAPSPSNSFEASPPGDSSTTGIARSHEHTDPSPRRSPEKPPPADSSAAHIAHAHEFAGPLPRKSPEQSPRADSSSDPGTHSHEHAGPFPRRSPEQSPRADSSTVPATHSHEHATSSPRISPKQSPRADSSAAPATHSHEQAGPSPRRSPEQSPRADSSAAPTTHSREQAGPSQVERSERPPAEPFTSPGAHSHEHTAPSPLESSERLSPADSYVTPVARVRERTEPSRMESWERPSAESFATPDAFAHERTDPSRMGPSEKPPPADSSATPVTHVRERTEPSPARRSAQSPADASTSPGAHVHGRTGPSRMESTGEAASADSPTAHIARAHVHSGSSSMEAVEEPPSADSSAAHVAHAREPSGPSPMESTERPPDIDETSSHPVSTAPAHRPNQDTPWTPGPAHADAPPSHAPRLSTRQSETPRTLPESSTFAAPLPSHHASSLTDELRDALFAFLLGHHADRYAGLSDDALLGLVQQTLDETPELLLGFFRQHLPRAHLHEHWARVLPESLLARLMSLLAPRMHASMLTTLELLSEAWLDVARAHGTPGPDRASLWQFILELLARHPGALLTLEHVVSRFLRHFAPRLRATPSDAADPLDLRARLLDRATELARADASHRLEALLRRRREALLNPRPPTPRPRPRTSRPTAPKAGRTAFQLGAESSHASDVAPIYIGNAGLVLTSPFLPHLLREAGLLRVEDGKTFLDPEPATRAVHLLQYLVDGSTSTPEPLLVLNKILCGLPISTPVPSEIQLTDQERTLCERLLRALIAHWKIISNTSIAGLRETFLQREGRLEHLEDRWKLQVQRKTLDVLVDQVPWSISILTHPWMPQPLYVSW
ncbi:hypothetical protein LY474_30150 [Myxococcus stipitatus]|uniref:contractile injection system tape measure protein n=1 Tax=Myxococcus stipitatus TaxID=83455 RepID=UPI001EED72AA|nr:contractile injection system tape measure protein [Myxococcus stipitatus]MCE9672076.1 hypothetical protein [Myxococcus stipitatus]